MPSAERDGPRVLAVADDSLMDRFEPNARRFRARDAVVAVLVAAVVLVLVQGSSMRDAGRRMDPGVERDVVLAVAGPAGWAADRLPLHDAARSLTSGLSPDDDLDAGAGFASLKTPAARDEGGADASGAPPAVTPDAFAPAAIGARPPAPKPLKTLLVTGDSLSTPLDLEMARRLAGKGVRVVRDPHLGTGLSKTDLLDWGELSASQSRKDKPDAVMVFIGANEGFPMDDPSGRSQACCAAPWAAVYANRARRVMANFRRNGITRVYWISVPTPRDPARQRIQRVVNAAIDVAAQPWRRDVTTVDTVGQFTPGGRYRDAMAVGGRKTIVRESDGIHLNPVGAGLLADRMVALLRGSFTF